MKLAKMSTGLTWKWKTLQIKKECLNVLKWSDTIGHVKRKGTYSV